MNIYKLMNKTKIQATYWALYTAGFSVLTGIMTSVHEIAIHELSKNGLESALHSGIEAIEVAAPFNGLINIVYSKAVDGIAKKYGRFGANIFCGAVNVGFYLYYSRKLATDPGFAVLMNAITGYTLTNQHITAIEKSVPK